MKNKIIVFTTLLAAMMVITGIVVAYPNPKNLEPLPASPHDSAIISNGLIQLGVNDQGHLNIPGGTPSSGSGTTFVGLRFLPTNAEATAPGCLCEGWGAADNITATTGYANVAVDGVVGMTLVSFSNDTTNATSIVNISSTLRVKHFYHPSVSPNLYQTDVSITNIGGASVELLYRRVMDWDIEPTFFDEFVTIQNGSAANISFTSNDGFASANPLSSPTPGFVFPTFTGSFIDAGPQDHGALFDFNFGMLAPGATKNFTTFYGAAGNTSDALSALGVVGAEAYSLGKPNNATTGLPLGEPNTFIFAFKGVGGVPIVTPPPEAKGNVTGGGWIVSPTPAPKNNRATFGFVAHYADGATTPSGNLQYTDHVSGMNVHGNVTTLSVNKTAMTATFSGTAKINGAGAYAYTVNVHDGGEPGKMVDHFNISIPGFGSYSAGGALQGGNIQIHDP